MNPPPFILAAALLFWGWQTGHPVWAAVMGASLELPRLIGFRLNWGQREHGGIWDLTVLLLAASVFFAFASWPLSDAVWILLQWLPILFFPLIAVAGFSRQSRLSSPVFLWLQRHRAPPPAGFTAFHPAYPYLATILLAASASTVKGDFYYGGCGFLLAWLLLAGSPPRALRITIPVLLLLFAAGREAHQEWRRWQLARTGAWMGTPIEREFDDASAFIFLNRIPELKTSGRIVCELTPSRPDDAPSRLRVATYNLMVGSAWIDKGRGATHPAKSTHGAWILLSGEPSRPIRANVAALFPRRSGLLALPFGTGRLFDLPALSLQRTRNGVVRVEDIAEAARFDIQYGWTHGGDAPPDAEMDFHIPLRELPALDQVIDRWQLSGRPAREVLSALQNRFTASFQYTLQPPSSANRPARSETALTRFLLHDRAGHCEQFASAAVLILRRLRIPARYATGYALPQDTTRDGVFVVRERHAHAWAMAHVDDRWIEFDPTPEGWPEAEARERSRLASLAEAAARLRFQFAFWRGETGMAAMLPYSLALLAGLIFWTGWRLIRSKGSTVPTPRPSRPANGFTGRPGEDSEWFQIARGLEAATLTRPPGETGRQWLARLESGRDGRDEFRRLAPALQLHYRYRFDPRGLSFEDRAELARHAREWLTGRPPGSA